MEPIHLMKKIRKEYIKARKSIAPAKNIKRGTSHTISSITEDLFAYYIYSHIDKNKFEIWIDQIHKFQYRPKKIIQVKDLYYSGPIFVFITLKETELI